MSSYPVYVPVFTYTNEYIIIIGLYTFMIHVQTTGTAIEMHYTTNSLFVFPVYQQPISNI